MTYGKIRQRLSQESGGAVSLDLIDGYIIDRYQEILDSLSWKRLQVERALTTVPEYNTGTLAAGNLETALTGTGTTWDATMDQRILRINADSDVYSFNFVDATSANLDRQYQNATATGMSYRINQNLYPLDSDVRGITAVRTAKGSLGYLTLGDLNRLAPARAEYGTPKYWTWYPDTVDDPPLMQVEVYPIPIDPISLYLSLDVDTAGLEAGVTSSSLLPWVRPACLIAGCEADMAKHLKDWNAHDRLSARFNTLLTEMRAVEDEKTGPTPLKMNSRYTRHQDKRWFRR